MNRPSPDEPHHDLVGEASSELDRAEEVAEQRAASALSGHRSLSGILRITEAVLREQAVERVGLAASGANILARHLGSPDGHRRGESVRAPRQSRSGGD